MSYQLECLREILAQIKKLADVNDLKTVGEVKVYLAQVDALIKSVKDYEENVRGTDYFDDDDRLSAVIGKVCMWRTHAQELIDEHQNIPKPH